MKSKTNETRSAGGVVLNQQDKVLICSQYGLSWSLPKGHIEEGEGVLTAAKREIFEESGISELELIRELGSYTRPRLGKDGKDDMSELKTITLFLFRTNQNDLKPIDPENPEARWVSKDKVAEMLTHQKDKEFFLQVMK